MARYELQVEMPENKRVIGNTKLANSLVMRWKGVALADDKQSLEDYAVRYSGIYSHRIYDREACA